MGISLVDILEKYSHIRLAEPQDNTHILSFLANVPMNSGQRSIRYDRSPDYFSFVRKQGEQAFVFVFEMDDGSVGGVASIIMRNQYIGGCLVRTGYHCDLRAHPQLSRKARVQWRRTYSEIVDHYKEIEEFGGCQYFYSALLSENKAAAATLQKNQRNSLGAKKMKGSKPQAFIYREIDDYTATMILGRVPGFSSLHGAKKVLRQLTPFLPSRMIRHQQKQYTWRKARAGDTQAIRAFLCRENKALNLGDGIEKGSQVDTDELSRRFAQWPDFHITSFILGFAESGELVATLCPWSNGDSRKLILEKAPKSQALLGSLLPFIGGKKIKSGKALDVLHLTHFHLSKELELKEKAELFTLLIQAVFQQTERKNYHMLSFLNPHDLDTTQLLKSLGFVIQSSSGTLCQVLSQKDADDRHFIPQSQERRIHFELAIA